MTPKFRRQDYEVVVVGGGVMGLFTAYHLSRHLDPERILVVDRGFLSSGASGRNGGGVRQQWETVPTVRLAKEAVEAYRRFPLEFGYNPWFRQGGYLFLAFSAEEEERLRRVDAAVRSEGLRLEWLSTPEILRRVPALDPERIVGGSYLRSDGVIFPFPVLWGLYRTLQRAGVEVAMRTEVLGFEQGDGAVRAVKTSAGSVRTSKVVNAAGGWSRDVGALAGLSMPNTPTRHEILATEPLKPFLDPMIVTLRRGVYFSQSMRGEVIGGLSLAHPSGPAGGMPSSLEFLREFAKELVALVPRLAQVRVLRSWAGFYDDTPDGLPVLGEDPRLLGFFQANGFGGHGFMLAPAAGPRVAQMVLGRTTDLDPAMFAPERFLRQAGGRAVEGIQLG
ncbi:MAG: FAD-binding oxidoreductase [Euryarchaeota archaeon]|nr:FAD-binding oxidoreductase [Euryarchaeota archaeon]MDE1836445.1 FAD-binding oxidoreductase [Euryarchaeota archaeon]MDE1879040.1 FAD-binding oxidoreductase [Euryarchaeota archaeon]MDE2044193.1 FAD-binding oxidoreductase [Thermoplasmata archaeon]